MNEGHLFFLELVSKECVRDRRSVAILTKTLQQGLVRAGAEASIAAVGNGEWVKKKRQIKGLHCECCIQTVLIVTVLIGAGFCRAKWCTRGTFQPSFSSPYGSPPTVFALAAKLGPLTALLKEPPD